MARYTFGSPGDEYGCGCGCLVLLVVFILLGTILFHLWPLLLLVAVPLYLYGSRRPVERGRSEYERVDPSAHRRGPFYEEEKGQFNPYGNRRVHIEMNGEEIDFEELFEAFFRQFADSSHSGGYGHYNSGQGGYQQGSRTQNASTEELYALFGLTPSCTDEELKKAYRKKVLIYHPDRVRNLPYEEQQKAAEQFKRVKSAYDTLAARRGMN